MRAAQRAAALCLLLAACAVTMGAAQEPPAGGAGPAAAAADPATAEPVSVCNPGTLAPNATKPVPCTPEQEAAALADLAADTNTTDPLAAVFDTSACDPADPEGYTQAVDLMNPELILVVTEVAEEFIAAAGNESFWFTGCAGDFTADPFNACQQPPPGPDAPPAERGLHFKVQLKLSCSIALNDTVALEAAAFLATPEGGNRTVAGVEWAEIPLPGVGQ